MVLRQERERERERERRVRRTYSLPSSSSLTLFAQVLLVRKFPLCLSPQESAPMFKLQKAVNMAQLVHTVAVMCGIKLSPGTGQSDREQ